MSIGSGSGTEYVTAHGRNFPGIRQFTTFLGLFRDFSGLRAGVGEVFSGIAAMSEC